MVSAGTYSIGECIVSEWQAFNLSEACADYWLAPPQNGAALAVCGVFVVAFGVARALRLFDPPVKPQVVYCNQSEYAQAVVDMCPILSEKYIPPWLWGRNGHIACLVFGIFGRRSSPSLTGEEHTMAMEDGAEATFTFFQRDTDEELAKVGEEHVPVLLVAPGIGNNCSAGYIQVFIESSFQRLKYCRVAVLNHLGTNKERKLASPRMFSYGCPMEYSKMVETIRERFPRSPLIAVGFSMGGNIVLNYFGIYPQKQTHFAAAVSLCQGYDLVTTDRYFKTITGCLYSFFLASNMGRLIRAHRSTLFQSHRLSSSVHAHHNCAETCFGLQHQRVTALLSNQEQVPRPDEKSSLWPCKMRTVDEFLMRRMGHFRSLDEFYSSIGSVHQLSKITNVPLLIVNAEDDPIVFRPLLSLPRNHAENNPLVLYVQPHHGSHLAFYEGGYLMPNGETWLDRLLAQYFTAVLKNQKLAQSV